MVVKCIHETQTLLSGEVPVPNQPYKILCEDCLEILGHGMYVEDGKSIRVETEYFSPSSKPQKAIVL